MERSADQAENNENSVEMSPKHGYEPPSENVSHMNVEEADLQEFDAVNERLDELSSALDFFEQRTDNMIEQLKELLHSNREIRAQLALEKADVTADSVSMDPTDATQG